MASGFVLFCFYVAPIKLGLLNVIILHENACVPHCMKTRFSFEMHLSSTFNSLISLQMFHGVSSGSKERHVNKTCIS